MNEESRISLLLIEDDKESGVAMLDMLRRRNVDVTLVETAEAGLAAMKEHAFDAAVSDIRLGEMSGVDFLAAVRKDDARFPVILLTGFDSLDSAIQAIRLGAQDYILKPLDSIDDLLVPVKHAIEARDLQHENEILTERLRSLASELVIVEDRERQRIACGLHDSIGQELIGLKLKLESAASEPQNRAAAPLLRDLEAEVRALVIQTRSLIFRIYPTTLHDLGLAGALENYLHQISEEYSIQSDFDAEADLPAVSDDLRILLFRSARELMFNTIKHANAVNLSVKVFTNEGDIVMTVQDDGKGFDTEGPAKSSRQGSGLFSIRQHLQNINGSLSIASQPGKGTIATVRAPCVGR